MKITTNYGFGRYSSDLSVKKYAELSADDQPYTNELASSAVPEATRHWNGVERRQSSDRRQEDRRQYRRVSMLDTRTQASDRRRHGRRFSDSVISQFIACKI
jgi:hypothetical protein